MKFLVGQHFLNDLETSGKSVFLNVPSAAPDKQKSSSEEEKNFPEITTELTSHSKEIERKYLEEADREREKIQESIRQMLGPEHAAQQLTLEQYKNKLQIIAAAHKDRVEDWSKKYEKWIPDNYWDNVKIGGIAGTIAYISSDGTVLQRMGKAAKWTAIGAVVTHPAITGSLTTISKTIGREVLAPGIVGIGSAVVSLIDNPQEFWDAMSQSKDWHGKSVKDIPLYKLLVTGRTNAQDFSKELATGNQNAFDLRAQGLYIEDENLRTVMDDIELYRTKEDTSDFPEETLDKAATFLLQTAEYSLSDEKMAAFRVKLWNEKATPDDIRHVLASNARRDTITFIEKNPKLWSQLQKKMQEKQESQIPVAQADLAKMFRDSTVSKNGTEFRFHKPKRGIRRFMSLGAGGASLAFYVLSFLTISGLMKVRNLAQVPWWKQQKEKVMSFAKKPKDILSSLVEKKNAEGILNKYQKVKPNPFTKKEKEAIWKEIKDNSDDKSALITQTKKFIEDQKDNKFKYNDLPEILKSKLKKLREKEA